MKVLNIKKYHIEPNGSGGEKFIKETHIGMNGHIDNNDSFKIINSP